MPTGDIGLLAQPGGALLDFELSVGDLISPPGVSGSTVGRRVQRSFFGGIPGHTCSSS